MGNKWKCWMVLLVATTGTYACIRGALSSDPLLNRYGYIITMILLISGSADLCIPGKTETLQRSSSLAVRLLVTLLVIALVFMDVKTGPANVWTVATASEGVVLVIVLLKKLSGSGKWTRS